MSDTIDSFSREQIAKLWTRLGTSVAELRALLIGVDGQNGLRSEIRNAVARIEALENSNDSLEARIQHYMDKEREETCLGLKALAKYENACAEEAEEDTKVEIAKIGAKGQVAAGAWQGVAIMVGQVLTLAGVILVVVLK
jgi:glycine cleavage system aminomethyltransferase T